MVEEINLQLPHIRLSARLWRGTGHGRLLMLHGWMDNAASFDALAPLLNAGEMVALELPGHGHSGHRPGGVHYHFVDYVTDVVTAIDVLKWDRLTLLGHSLGAAVASFAAVMLPHRVERLILIEGIGPLTGEPEQEPERMARSIKQLPLLERRQPKVIRSLDEAITVRRRNSDLTEEATARLVERGTIAVNGGWQWRHDPRLVQHSPIYPTEDQVRAFLRRIECETLLVESTNGLLAKRPTTDGRCDCIERLQRVMLSGGHHLHMEASEQVAATINEFIDE